MSHYILRPFIVKVSVLLLGYFPLYSEFYPLYKMVTLSKCLVILFFMYRRWFPVE